MTGEVGSFTHAVSGNAATHPHLYRETRDGPQLLYITALFATGFLRERKRSCNRLDRGNWQQDGNRVTCRKCKGFIGYAR